MAGATRNHTLGDDAAYNFQAEIFIGILFHSVLDYLEPIISQVALVDARGTSSEEVNMSSLCFLRFKYVRHINIARAFKKLFRITDSLP